ncbi:methionine ABC transporter permease [Aerococcus urinae]|uniref:methionine ABC transporter permease n=1 Tax=Aerococcus urinae TaxID=1376 RepID=UPI00254BC22C|nr:methionine ABC transporter permease [Aerococcus urinae]MDK7195246.1 methionine ABC transporter permease [Aerococcus urinae]MDK7919423.1 methionine ABC transporter permease [Aerococcus urinae]
MEASLVKLSAILGPSVFDTAYMVFFTMILSTALGFVIAVALYYTDKEGLIPNALIYSILDVFINIVRSFPFIILVVAVIPLTRGIVGGVIGRTAALVPLTISGTATVARLLENSFREVGRPLIEAIRSFGASDYQIMKEVVLVEAAPLVIVNLTVAIIGIIGTTSAAGTVGAGGLGSVAINYGYNSFDSVIMYGTVLVIILIVHCAQFVGNYLYKQSLR